MDGVVYACDIGSVKSGSFAWSRATSHQDTPTASSDIDELLIQIVRDARSGASVALGFEAPLFMPIPLLSSALSSGRNGESSRSMFAPAGASVTTLALHEVAWILRSLQQQIGSILGFTIDWRKPWRSSSGAAKLLVWEAFVSSSAHSDTHERDAITAARHFIDYEHHFAEVNAVTCENPLSLVHCAAMFAGWSRDINALHGDCLVLKPAVAYDGPIDPA